MSDTDLREFYLRYIGALNARFVHMTALHDAETPRRQLGA
jgi:hypothetical protein